MTDLTSERLDELWKAFSQIEDYDQPTTNAKDADYALCRWRDRNPGVTWEIGYTAFTSAPYYCTLGSRGPSIGPTPALAISRAIAMTGEVRQ